MPRRATIRTLARSACLCTVMFGVVAVLGTNAFWECMRRSMPRSSGVVRAEGLSSSVRIARDQWGRPRIDAQSLRDAAFGVGFLHAQDRFFQMDLSRRLAAGRLAELLGPPLVSTDRESRRYEGSRTAREVVAALPPRHRELIEAYAEGVNAGLADLGAWPFEYMMLASRPEPWTPEDSILVVLSMFRSLALFGNFERSRESLEAALPPEVVAFLLPEATRFDAPVEGGSGYTPAPIPGADVFDLRARSAQGISGTPAEEIPRGSNAWVVSGARTSSGGAIMANDMHLGIMVPAPWYWAEMHWVDGGTPRRAVGVTLAGLPAIVAGSNGQVAWGFTNVTGDVADWVIVEPVDGEPSRYRTPEGSAEFGAADETIRVRFAPDVRTHTRTTVWGRVIREDPKGRPLVLKWTGTEARCIDLGLMDMLNTQTLESALDVGAAWKGPPQNIMVASRDGRIGWTIGGSFPVRAGFDGRRPVSWATPGVEWWTWIAPADKPRIIEPESGFIATANARTLAEPEASKYGHNFSLGVRQQTIARSLETAPGLVDERAMQLLQNDTSLEIGDFWARLIIDVAGDDAEFRAAADAARAWDGHANTDSIGVPLIQRFRAKVRDEVFGAVESAVAGRASAPALLQGWLNQEEPLRRIVEERPAHWVPAKFASWDALLKDALRRAMAAAPAGTTWGEENRTEIAHPLSSVAGGTLRRLDMPREPFNGHTWAIRVMGDTFGASERMALSPGREEEGLVQLPCGASGHPLSEWYRSTHELWMSGRSIPALVDPTRGAFEIVPAGR